MIPKSETSSTNKVQNVPVVQINGLGTALPTHQWSQIDVLNFVLKRFQLKERTKLLYQKILTNPSIQKRAFSLENLEEAVTENPDKRSLRFEKEAVSLSTQSLQKALIQSGFQPHNIDYLVVATCTGYLCPGLSSYLIESCDLRRDIHHSDLVGMGCGAAIPAIEQAANFIKANPGTLAAVVSTEICSAAFFNDEEPETIISNSIFGDGSGALLLKGEDRIPKSTITTPVPTIKGFASLTIPEWRNELRFEKNRGLLRNVLSKDIPTHAASATKKVVDRLLRDFGIKQDQIKYWMIHAGGEKILSSIQQSFSLQPEALLASRKILQEKGNMSSPTVLFVLEQAQKNTAIQSGDLAIVSSFGAGFTAHAALLEY